MTTSNKPTEPGEVVERLAAAEVGSRELDCALAVLLDGYIEEPSRYGWEAHDYAYIDGEGGRVSPGHGGDQLVPHYTTSLDAALALAERVLPADPDFSPATPSAGWKIDIYRGMVPSADGGGWFVTVRRHATDGIRVAKSSPALALCAAILRAHPSDGESK